MVSLNALEIMALLRRDEIIIADSLLLPYSRFIRALRKRQHEFLFFRKICLSAASGTFLKRLGVDEFQAFSNRFLHF